MPPNFHATRSVATEEDAANRGPVHTASFLAENISALRPHGNALETMTPSHHHHHVAAPAAVVCNWRAAEMVLFYIRMAISVCEQRHVSPLARVRKGHFWKTQRKKKALPCRCGLKHFVILFVSAPFTKMLAGCLPSPHPPFPTRRLI